VLKKAGFNVAVKHIDLTPVSFMSQIQASQVLTQDEQREILGYKPIVNQNQINDGNTNQA
jgi:hypothetical protein